MNAFTELPGGSFDAPPPTPAGGHVLLTLPSPGALPASIRAKALVFDDPVSIALLHRAERVARSDASVLIMGETGTGKELVARHVHACSGRPGPFVAVNCGAFSETMVEAELFGHEAGAYTDARSARPGWFETARHGTLFLDEVGDLPLAMQVKLLRVLQERQVVRLGSRTPVEVDVRVVAATNVDLARAVQAGHFRRDLYYRLAIATLQVPALARRPNDILALAQHFIELYGRKLGRGLVRLAPPARAALLQHDWPGNIRELENVIHCALIVASGPEITVEALNLRAPPTDEGMSGPSPVPAPPAVSPAERLHRVARELLDSGQPDPLAAAERAVLTAAWTQSGGNQVHTAALLGIGRHALRNLLKRHGLLGDAGDAAIVGTAAPQR